MTLNDLEEQVERIYIDMENELLLNIAKKLSAGKPMEVDKWDEVNQQPLVGSGEVNEWQLQRLKELNGLNEENAKIIAKYSGKTVEEVKIFLDFTAGRVKTDLLVETPEAVECLDQILALEGIDEIHVGINDLHLGYHRKFMFELLADGTVEKICEKADKCGLKYGFGGIARIGCGELPAERIIREHYRLGSTKAIVSRSFCDTGKITDRDEIRRIFDEGIAEIRALEKEVAGEKEQENSRYFEENRREVIKIVDKIIGKDAGEK